MFCNQSVTTKIFTRGNIHYLRYRVPRRIQLLGFPPEVVKSLKTRDYLFAQKVILSKMSLLQRIEMSTDKTLLKLLFDELTDFSFTDRLDRHERGEVSLAIEEEVDHVRDCMEDGCASLHSGFPEDVARLTIHGEPLKTIIPEGYGELYELLLTLLKAHASNAGNGRSNEFRELLDKANHIAVPSSSVQAPEEIDLMPFSALYAEFLEYKVTKGGLSDKMQTTRRLCPDRQYIVRQ